MTYWKKKTQEKTTATVETLGTVALPRGGATRYALRSTRYQDDTKSIPAGAKGRGEKKVGKGTRGMPRLPEAKKDAISCDKRRGSANKS